MDWRMYAPRYPLMLWPKLENPARSANTVDSTPWGQSFEMRIVVGMKFSILQVFWTAA